MYAVIDIGSNTIRLSVYTIQDNHIKPMFHRKNMSSLIGYVDEKGCMTERGIQKAITVLSNFKKIIDNIEVENIYVFATASFRNIQNRELVVRAIKEAANLDVTIISGEEEAICGFIGAAYNVNVDSGLLVDIGGGSTELVFYKDRKICKVYSIPMGSLDLYVRFVSGLLPTKEEYRRMKKYIREQLESIDPGEVPTTILCGVGGTNRAACKLSNDYFNMPLSNRSMELNHIKKLLKSFYQEKDGIERVLRVVPERIHTIIPGMTILKTISKQYQCEKMIVSEYGVREGYLIKTVIEWENGEE
ncbi:phosphatase [Sinanaerobacter chloroacetimidivorans]|uniref:Phosphatase n=1 Tax=Sinanaerobacter chloroacetimidivorans TaxID=2818044 RepID=A0A8J7VY81_9FIRM|nr:phosphatase [Sinanaerobacter chloroacetimidivorans]MBR0596886.1 phosphatase [Sinanaerobacter chloroacetimidivorans]